MEDICANYHGGNPQSVAANLRTNKNRDRQRILDYLATVEDATCDEVEKACGFLNQTCSARMAELKRDGLIEPRGLRKTKSGCTARAWALCAPGSVVPVSVGGFGAAAKCGATCRSRISQETAEAHKLTHERTCPRCRIVDLESLLRREQALRDPNRNDGFNREPGTRYHNEWKLARDIDAALKI